MDIEKQLEHEKNEESPSQSHSHSPQESIQILEPIGIEEPPLPTVYPSQWRLTMIVVTICTASMFAMSDQTGIPLLLSFIGENLGSNKSIQWAGTGALICSTISNIFVGRAVNLFGNKILFLIGLAIICIFEILCYFVKDKITFYICRSLTGLGNGGIISISMVIMSDVVHPKRRGTFQGILGFSIGVGSCIGPYIASGFVNHDKTSGWRKYFCFMGLMFLFILILSILSIPNKLIQQKLDCFPTRKARWLSIDYGGLFLSIATVILALIPLNMGGLLWDWDSLPIILCSTFAIVALVLLIIVECTFPKTAVIPPKFFNNFKVSNFLIQTFLISIIYSSMIYYIPFYLTAIQEKNISEVPHYFLALLIPLSLSSFGSGLLTSYLNQQKYVIIGGFTLLFIGVVLLSVLLETSTSDIANIFIFITIGTGAGFIFTPTTVAIQNQVNPNEKSVVLSTKGVFKTLGHSVGVAISSMIYTNTLLNELDKIDIIKPSDITFVLKNVYKKMTLNYAYNGTELNVIETIYSTSLKNVFLSYIPLAIICLILSMFINEKPNTSRDQSQQEQQEQQ
ncbi:putative MFS-type transporter [Wickerhamomyces ciferrii]|uniref:MFS-type transporter n=1 Tax=Wickerhamomyces ciferrii (strain ATCC 14091 / BCRC 22168 / CBS 111 / JCM 3599 / NBRC 0793 / NRRL Y-1031 F-60-10) TaxID=1206466 RepID=K0KQ96_WICCF|nr:putative MFS-type transporter [Wickerhamomyces ciferrii]CCH44327.1 putative MFS-type transporter [Wickerhamomyces ciferrii]